MIHVFFQYKVGEGENAILYDIKFDLTVKELSQIPGKPDYQVSEDAESDDKSGEGNSFVLSSKGGLDYGGQRVFGITTPSDDGSSSASRINVEDSKEANERGTGAHEIGHTFGLGHFLFGLMKDGVGGRPNQSITRSNMKYILNNIGIGKLPLIQWAGQGSNDGEGTLQKEVGAKPKEFEDGRVVKAK